MTKKKKIKKGPPPPVALPEETVSYFCESPFGKVFRRKMTGRLSSVSAVVFSLSLPELECDGFAEAKAVLDAVAAEYLSFLEEKSREEREPFFGGLHFSVTDSGFLLSQAFCPVKERSFVPAFSLSLSPEGRLKSLGLIKK